MAKILGGHLVGKYLKEYQNVNTVFTLSGGHIEYILDSFNKYAIRAIDVRHEQAAAMMAHAWSIYTGTPGVCLVTAGPGFTNALTGIANAFLDNSPLVVLSGRHPLRDDLTGALQELDQISMVRPVTKWAQTCYDAKRIPEYLSIAFREAVSGRPGPVFLELPPDILSSVIEERDVLMPVAINRKMIISPVSSDLEKAAAYINEAKRPLFIGGSGCGFSNAQKAISEFIEKTKIPFALLNNGRGTLSDNHPQCINDGCFTGIMTALPQADVIIAAGIRFNWVLESGKVFPDAKVIRIDINPSELDRNRTSQVGLPGDVGEVIAKLTTLVEEGNHSQWEEKLRKAYAAFIATELDQRSKASYPIHPVRLVAKIQEFFGADTYYVADGGDTSYFGMCGFNSNFKSGVMGPAGSLLGCLGTGIPFAMAAKVANPDKQVVLLNGDGSFGFNAMEFDTMLRLDIPVICVINNDNAWGMIKHSQGLNIGYDNLSCSELGERHYEKMVEGLGGYGELVTKDEDIIPALQRAVDSKKPACINVLTDNTVTSPATIQFYQNLSDF